MSNNPNSDLTYTDNTSQPSEEKHDTNYWALALISTLSLSVIVIALTQSGQLEDNQTGENQPVSKDTEQIDRAVPTQSVTTIKETGRAKLPEGLPVPESAETIQNYSADIPNGTQRVLIYDTEDSLSDIYTDYQGWVEQNPFAVGETQMSENSGFIRATGKELEKLNIAISAIDSKRRVQVNYIEKQQHNQSLDPAPRKSGKYLSGHLYVNNELFISSVSTKNFKAPKPAT